MQRSFMDYAKERQLQEMAVALLDSGVNVDAWVDGVTDIFETYELDSEGCQRVVLEVLDGLMGVGKAAISGAANSVANAGSSVMGGIKSGLQKGAQIAGQVGNYAMQQAKPMIQGAKTAYTQGEIDGVIKKVQGLRNTLVNAKVGQPTDIDNFLKDVTGRLQGYSQQMNPMKQQQFNFA